jgi:hypothetical protein
VPLGTSAYSNSEFISELWIIGTLAGVIGRLMGRRRLPARNKRVTEEVYMHPCPKWDTSARATEGNIYLRGHCQLNAICNTECLN